MQREAGTRQQLCACRSVCLCVITMPFPSQTGTVNRTSRKKPSEGLFNDPVTRWPHQLCNQDGCDSWQATHTHTHTHRQTHTHQAPWSGLPARGSNCIVWGCAFAFDVTEKHSERSPRLHLREDQISRCRINRAVHPLTHDRRRGSILSRTVLEDYSGSHTVKCNCLIWPDLDLLLPNTELPHTHTHTHVTLRECVCYLKTLQKGWRYRKRRTITSNWSLS